MSDKKDEKKDEKKVLSEKEKQQIMWASETVGAPAWAHLIGKILGLE